LWAFHREAVRFGTTALAFGVTLGFTQLAAFALVLQSSGRPDVAVWHPLRIIDVVNAAMSVEIFPASNFVMTVSRGGVASNRSQ
jgi:hypothetical protein